jgi:hypothetical protein
MAQQGIPPNFPQHPFLDSDGGRKQRYARHMMSYYMQLHTVARTSTNPEVYMHQPAEQRQFKWFYNPNRIPSYVTHQIVLSPKWIFYCGFPYFGTDEHLTSTDERPVFHHHWFHPGTYIPSGMTMAQLLAEAPASPDYDSRICRSVTMSPLKHSPAWHPPVRQSLHRTHQQMYDGTIDEILSRPQASPDETEHSQADQHQHQSPRRLDFDDLDDGDEYTQAQAQMAAHAIKVIKSKKKQKQIGSTRIAELDEHDTFDFDAPFHTVALFALGAAFKADCEDIQKVKDYYLQKQWTDPITGSTKPWREICKHLDDSKQCQCRPACGVCGLLMHLRISGNATNKDGTNGFYCPPGTPAFICPRTHETSLKYIPSVNKHPSAFTLHADGKQSAKQTYMPANKWIKTQCRKISAQYSHPEPIIRKFMNLYVTKQIIAALVRVRTWETAHGSDPIERPDSPTTAASTSSTAETAHFQQAMQNAFQ